MRKAFWLTGGLCGVAALCQGVPAWAETAATTPEQDIPDLSPIAPPESISCPTSLDAACAGPEEDGMAQVRSVSELSDIQPSDWAYQAVRSLIERYGVAGYPDGTFRGNQPLTRYEFAAAVAQLLATVEQLAATGGITTSLREDLDTLRRLQTTYDTIANSLRDRLNPLDGVITQLEAKQFSATSKLSGQTVLAVTDGTNASST
ncbi:S-layer homology domain-containing protein, partial [Leptolyngbya sp. FACHB-36]|uniref:iron uptake porin n=1 Tax=Leptolyngbya sp. FACHB-36 TaxID=2692808 RepID=UPI0016802701|nr:S-layer homology domain-containing protein [Leptolyngbya sp. FACHB-36]